MNIRKASKKDYKEILKLDKEASKEISWWETLKKSNLLKDLLYVIEKDKLIIGYLRASKKKNFIELEDLFLKKEYRNKGLSKKLSLFFIKDIKKSKYKKIKLICPERLRNFNEKIGFKVTSLNMIRNLK